MSETHKHYWRYIDEGDDSDLGVCACGATGVIYFGNGEVLDIKTREQHDSLLAEVERVKREHWQFKMHVLEAIGFPYEVHDNEAAGRVHNLIIEKDAAIASLEADNARLASEQQHCAKCGGVECHALAGMFCGGHSYEGCGEWGGCPICENAKLKSALAASGVK